MQAWENCKPCQGSWKLNPFMDRDQKHLEHWLSDEVTTFARLWEKTSLTDTWTHDPHPTSSPPVSEASIPNSSKLWSVAFQRMKKANMRILWDACVTHIVAIVHAKWGRDPQEKKTLKCRRNYNSCPSPSISQVEFWFVCIQYHSLEVHVLFLSNLMGLFKYFLVHSVNQSMTKYLGQKNSHKRQTTQQERNEDNMLQGVLQLNTVHGCRQLLIKVSVKGRELLSTFILLVPLPLGQHCLGDCFVTVELLPMNNWCLGF